ncbi:MAG: hypothetical protein ABIW82_18435 [Dokdonella sp.]
MNLKIVCLLLASVVFHSVQASQPADAWSARCELDQRHLVVKLVSASGDAAENLDMTMEVEDDVGRRIQVKIKPDLYFPFPSSKPMDDVCEGMASRRIGRDVLALFIARDGRPEANYLTLVLLNWKSMHVIGVRDDFGEVLSETFDVRQLDTNSADVRVARWDATKESCDCAEGYSQDWLRLHVSGTRWSADWLKPVATEKATEKGSGSSAVER